MKFDFSTFQLTFLPNDGHSCAKYTVFAQRWTVFAQKWTVFAKKMDSFSRKMNSFCSTFDHSAQDLIAFPLEI